MALTGLRRSGRKDHLESCKQKHEKKHEKKLEKKLRFYAKVKDAVEALAAKKAITKNKKKRLRRKKIMKAYDLSSLAEFLPDLDASQPPPDATNTKLNCKSRKKLLQRESLQLSAVLNNPTFQMDPVSAIQNHLERTQPPPDVDVIPKEKMKKKKHNRPGSSKRKAKAKKKGAIEPSSSSQSYMDI